MKFIPHFTTSVLITALVVTFVISKILVIVGMNEALAFIFAFIGGAANLVNMGDSEPPYKYKEQYIDTL